MPRGLALHVDDGSHNNHEWHNALLEKNINNSLDSTKMTNDSINAEGTTAATRERSVSGMDPKEENDRKEEDEEEFVEEEEVEDDDDFAPLVAPTHQSHALSWKDKQALGDQSKNPRRKKQQRRWMERLRRLRHRRLRHHVENDDTSCMADICRLVGSLLLASMFFGPWIYIHITRNSPSSSTLFDDGAAKRGVWPDDSGCAKRLQVNFTDLYLRIQQTTNATEFCETQVKRRTMLHAHDCTRAQWFSLVSHTHMLVGCRCREIF